MNAGEDAYGTVFGTARLFANSTDNSEQMSGKPKEKSSVAGILSALSYALDLVEGQPQGHAARTALIAVRLARAIGLEEASIRETFYVSILKDSGCSDNSARVHKLFGGDDLLAKRNVKLIDWSNPVVSVKYALSHLVPGGSVVEKLRKVPGLLGPPNLVMDRLTEARCTRASMIARKLGFSAQVGEALQNLDEHWDGKGSCRHLKGQEIPLLSRVVSVAQTLEVFTSTFGIQAGFDMLEARKGKWFEPTLVKAARRLREDECLWELHRRHLEDPNVAISEIDLSGEATEADIDQICEAFANIIDAKSSFTAEHSSRVAGYAVELASFFGFSKSRLTILRRAALLHDVGKLGVSNLILDKPDKLTDEEFATIRLHPKYSHEILERIRGFERITDIASAHHEKLDGTGYWRGLSAEHLDLDMRILSVADVFDALTAARPYRDALPYDIVFSILKKDAGRGLDAECVQGMWELKVGAVEKAA
jgi:putative nucleotidyltransferase with HDIG domain